MRGSHESVPAFQRNLCLRMVAAKTDERIPSNDPHGIMHQSSMFPLWEQYSWCWHSASRAYDWFIEGFGAADLKEVKALLDELA
jgi:hypothetical protein